MQQVGARDEVLSLGHSGGTRANAFIFQQHLEMFHSGLRDERVAFKVGGKGPKTLEEAAT
jgi:hypothetical protein